MNLAGFGQILETHSRLRSLILNISGASSPKKMPQLALFMSTLASQAAKKPFSFSCLNSDVIRVCMTM